MNKEIEYVMTVKDCVNKTEKKVFITSALPVHGKKGFFVLARGIVTQMLPENSEIVEFDLETLEEAAKNAEKKATK